MKIAVLSLTRDRLAYTQHCFEALRVNAGCDYDHYVLDQGSTDGTPKWLQLEFEKATRFVVLQDENLGISRGMNWLLDELNGRYDVIVKIDNDCELTQPATLLQVCWLVMAGNAILSPRILGLNNPPPITGEFTIGTTRILNVPQIGGIFLAVPASVYAEYRYPEDGPIWGMDDAHICRWFRDQGGDCGYVKHLEAWHYQTTSGQHATYPEYFERTLAEGKPSL